MTEVLFYHLQNMSVENVLPPLLEKSLERGWRVVVQSTSEERADALDAHLWTYRDESFLPHATWRAGDAEEQPILLMVADGNPNRANVRFLIDNAALPADSESYERMIPEPTTAASRKAVPSHSATRRWPSEGVTALPLRADRPRVGRLPWRILRVAAEASQ